MAARLLASVASCFGDYVAGVVAETYGTPNGLDRAMAKQRAYQDAVVQGGKSNSEIIEPSDLWILAQLVNIVSARGLDIRCRSQISYSRQLRIVPFLSLMQSSDCSRLPEAETCFCPSGRQGRDGGMVTNSTPGSQNSFYVEQLL